MPDPATTFLGAAVIGVITFFIWIWSTVTILGVSPYGEMFHSIFSLHGHKNACFHGDSWHIIHWLTVILTSLAACIAAMLLWSMGITTTSAGVLKSQESEINSSYYYLALCFHYFGSMIYLLFITVFYHRNILGGATWHGMISFIVSALVALCALVANIFFWFVYAYPGVTDGTYSSWVWVPPTLYLLWLIYTWIIAIFMFFYSIRGYKHRPQISYELPRKMTDQ